MTMEPLELPTLAEEAVDQAEIIQTATAALVDQVLS